MTLLEVLVTLGLISTVLLTLAIVFGQSLSTVQHSKAESVSIFIAESVQARLLTDPEWPPGSAKESFSRDVDEYGMPKDTFDYDELYYDGEGTEIEKGNSRAVYQGVLTFSRSPNYESRRLDFIAFEVKRLPESRGSVDHLQFSTRPPRAAS